MGRPKLTLPLGGGLLIGPVLELAAAVSGAEAVFVVLRPGAERELEQEVARRGLRAVVAERAAEGQSASLKAGVRAVAEAMPEARGVIVFLGDQPGLQESTVRAVLQEFEAQSGMVPVAPEFEGRRGHPVILPQRAFAAVQELGGDVGARDILQAFGLRAVPSSDRAVLQDVDTPEAYAVCVAEWEAGKSNSI